MTRHPDSHSRQDTAVEHSKLAYGVGGSLANWVTVFRLLLLFLFVIWVYQTPFQWPLFNVAFLGVIFILDAVDGFVARIRDEASVFGAVFDIAADRVVENILWLVLVDLGWVPVWVGIVFLTRSFLVDSLRSGSGQEVAPFELMRSPLGRFLVKGRFMRFSYALVKFLVFAVLFGLIPLAEGYPELWYAYRPWFLPVADALVYLAVALCVIRGLPVLFESLLAQASGSHDARSN